MFKKTMLLLTAAAAVLAFAAPAASANWTHSGEVIPGGTNPSINLTGTVSFTSGLGGVHCNEGTATIQATGGSTDGHVTAFGVEDPTKCDVTGFLAFIAGGTNSLTKVTLTGTPTAKVEGGDIRISGVQLHNTFKNTSITLGSTETALTADPDNNAEISSGSLSGTLNNETLGGTVTVKGNMSVINGDAKTYGIE